MERRGKETEKERNKGEEEEEEEKGGEWWKTEEEENKRRGGWGRRCRRKNAGLRIQKMSIKTGQKKGGEERKKSVG